MASVLNEGLFLFFLSVLPILRAPRGQFLIMSVDYEVLSFLSQYALIQYVGVLHIYNIFSKESCYFLNK